MHASGDWLDGITDTKKDEVDRASIVAIPVWILKDMIKRYQEYEKEALSLHRRRAANEWRGKWQELEVVISDPAWLEHGRQLLADLATAQIKPPCHHVWTDVTLNEDAQKGKKRKLCQICSEVVVE